MQIQEHDLLAYRNGIYQGPTKDTLRHGQGILLFDSNQMVVGTFHNDKLSGKFLYFSQHYIFYGHCQEGKLAGANVLLELKSGKVVKGSFLNGRLVGEYTLIDTAAKKEQEYVPSDSGKVLLRAERLEGDVQVLEFHRMIQFAKQIVQQDQYLVIEKKQRGVFIGYCSSLPHNSCNLGVTLYGLKVFELGLSKDSKLEGPGLRLQDAKVQDGVFKNGVLVEGRTEKVGERDALQKKRAKAAKKKWNLLNTNFKNDVLYSSSIVVLDSKTGQMAFLFKTRKEMEESAGASPSRLKAVTQGVENALREYSNRKDQQSPSPSRKRRAPTSFKSELLLK